MLRSVLLTTAAASAGGASCDGVRPSTFTAGWNEPAPSSSAEAPGGSGQDAGAVEPVEEDEPEAVALPLLQIFKDWRDGHDSSQPCPPEMVLVRKSYCIDRWEGSLVEIRPEGVRAFPHNNRPEQRPIRAVSRPNVMPQGYISGAEAQRACEMAGKRLCTDDEWFDACEGPNRTIFPYGTVLKKMGCNGDRVLHPMLELYGADAGPDIWMVEPMNNPDINAQPGTVALTGAHRECVGPDGIHDMVGNVQEWTNDPAGTFRGGAYSTNNLLGCQYVTTVHGFGYHDYSTGFRCCSDPYAQ